MRRAKARGTSFGYPDPVNPLIPMVKPFKISAAASSDVTTFPAKVKTSNSICHACNSRTPVGIPQDRSASGGADCSGHSALCVTP